MLWSGKMCVTTPALLRKMCDMKHVIRKDRAEQLRREKKEKERIAQARKDKIKERRAAHGSSDVALRRTSSKVCALVLPVSDGQAPHGHGPGKETARLKRKL